MVYLCIVIKYAGLSFSKIEICQSIKFVIYQNFIDVLYLKNYDTLFLCGLYFK